VAGSTTTGRARVCAATTVGVVDETTFSVSDLTTAIQQALDTRFPTEVWIQGEISSLNRSAAGHVYFQLVEPGEPGSPPVAQIPITLFSRVRESVNATLNRVGDMRMTDGVEIRLRGQVAIYGQQGRLQVRMSAIDPEFTLGRMASERDRILATLRTEKLLEQNGLLVLPVRPVRIGLVTSQGSAAEADFLHELTTSGLAWDVDAIDVRVQGAEAEMSIVHALTQLAGRGVEVIALVRGGGAKTDLVAFDSEAIARTIAGLSVPVFTGIGHEIDTSVADFVAHTASKTPTACAAALVRIASEFRDQVAGTWATITARAVRRLDDEQHQLHRASAASVRAAQSAIVASDVRIAETSRRLTRTASRSIDHARIRLTSIETRALALDPQRALRRGWSITRTLSGTLVRSVNDLQPDTELFTTLVDGTFKSRVSEQTASPSKETDRDQSSDNKTS